MSIRTIFFLLVVIVAAVRIARYWRLPPSSDYGSVDAIVPAYNEELCIVSTVKGLLASRYIRRVIVVDDGSTDRTAEILDLLKAQHPGLLVIRQQNTGKGGAIMAGVAECTAPYVLLTDADTILPTASNGIGYLIAELERGADAVGGIPASDLNGAGLLPHIRATLKLPMIAIQRTFQQVAGGAPFLISGACGLFRTEVLREVPFSDRTTVEDLDMTWSLVGRGYRVRQSSRCIVYSQECNTLKAEWLRWRRWIIGYAVCMRLHRKLLLSRFGLFSIMPMFFVVAIGIAIYANSLAAILATGQPHHIYFVLFPTSWLIASVVMSAFSACFYRKVSLLLLAPTAVFYLLLAYTIWLVHGSRGLFTGRERQRDKPLRYAHVVG